MESTKIAVPLFPCLKLRTCGYPFARCHVACPDEKRGTKMRVSRILVPLFSFFCFIFPILCRRTIQILFKHQVKIGAIGKADAV